MAGRKKSLAKSRPASPDGERAFAVVVEQLRGDFKVFGEALGGLREHVTEELVRVRADFGGLREEFGGLRGEVNGLRQQMIDGFERVDREIGEVRRELGEVKGELGEVKGELGEVKRDVGELKVDLGLVKSAVTTHTRELREIRSALGNKVERGEVEAIVEHAIARVAGR